MGFFKLSLSSTLKLRGVHEDLRAVVRHAIDITPLDFTVTEGLRSLERQRELCESGASRTMRSRHLTGHAVDLAALVGGDVRWDWPLYNTLGETMKKAAAQIGIPIEWGGDWESFKDGPHFQLPWDVYPCP